MAADQDRAERIKLLKEQRPDLTWRVIADRVDVSERAAIAWAKSGGIEYDNAKKLAGVFEVDVDYIMRGRPEETPDPFANPDGDLADRLDRIERALEDNRELLLALAEGLKLQQPAEAPHGPPWERLDRLRAELAARDREASGRERHTRTTSTG